MAQTQGLYRHDKQDGLTKQQRQVKELLTEKGLTQMQAGDELGLSRQRIRQIVVDLMKKGVEIPGAKPPKTVGGE